MDFTHYSDPNESAQAVQAFLRSKDGRALPKDVQDRAWGFLAPGGSISFAVANFVELIYARRADVSPIALALAASVGSYCQLYNVDGLGGERGAGVLSALRRDSGEKMPNGRVWAPESDDPKPRHEFVKAETHRKPAPKPRAKQSKAK